MEIYLENCHSRLKKEFGLFSFVMEYVRILIEEEKGVVILGEFIDFIINILLHLDTYLGNLIQDYGFLTHFLLFLVIFCETGLVVAPFLPGDSLLFAAGAFAALGSLNLFVLWILLLSAAILGDAVNYHIGKVLGDKIIKKGLIKRHHIERTERFFDKHGGKTIVIARFMPIIRTVAPFVAGAGHMKYRYFLSYNVIGGCLWISLCLLAGFFFGNIPVVKDNFTLVILAIVAISCMPAVVVWLKSRLSRS